MGIITDVELRTGKTQLAKSLKGKGVAAAATERLPALAKKVEQIQTGGGPVAATPPLPAVSVATSVAAI